MAKILITGCSTGIGKETALTLARAGHQVFASMRNLSKATDLEETAQSEGLKIEIIQMDVDSDASVSKGVAAMISSADQIDALVNNAGIAPLGHVEETPVDTFRQVMETNFFGAVRCMQAVLPTMRRQGHGCIVNITSVSGRLPSSPYGAYTASKHALESMSECLAQEVKAFNIRIANVEPGFVETPILDKQGVPPADSIYPQWKRIHGLMLQVRKNPVPPTLTAEQVKEIIEGDSWQLRYPVGPDAAPFLDWRNSMTDEEWIALGGAEDDEVWYARMEKDFGINARWP